jgi:hypothetical protein
MQERAIPAADIEHARARRDHLRDESMVGAHQA